MQTAALAQRRKQAAVLGPADRPGGGQAVVVCNNVGAGGGQGQRGPAGQAGGAAAAGPALPTVGGEQSQI